MTQVVYRCSPIICIGSSGTQRRAIRMKLPMSTCLMTIKKIMHKIEIQICPVTACRTRIPEVTFRKILTCLVAGSPSEIDCWQIPSWLSIQNRASFAMIRLLKMWISLRTVFWAKEILKWILKHSTMIWYTFFWYLHVFFVNPILGIRFSFWAGK